MLYRRLASFLKKRGGDEDMCFEDNRRNRRVELKCECREVRSNRDDRHHDKHHHDRHRNDEFRCNCREDNRRRNDFWW